MGRSPDPGYPDRRIASARPKHQSQPKEHAIHSTERAAAIDEVIVGYEELMHRMAGSHAPEFLEIAVTMPQAKLLYLLGAAGDLHMSALVARLGVSLSTVSGLVDRIVEAGLATRREDPADRRQVVVGLTPGGKDFIDRFRELNARQMRELLAHLDDEGLEHVKTGLEALARAANQLGARTGAGLPAPSDSTPVRKDPA
jgi:DNA-binding MarR family transcriptional regulator